MQCLRKPKKYTSEGGMGSERSNVFTVEAFRMAKYPVMNVQYRAFADAPDGFCDPAWWDFSEAANEWRKYHASAVEPANFSAYQSKIMPAMGICWYEAVAYCRWLSAKTDLQILLPTEVQWQRAAQGDDGRTYPWGNKYREIKDSQIKRGQYSRGASPYGVMGMSFETSEWCLNIAGSPASTYLDGNDNRAARGGLDSFSARIAFSDSRRPNDHPLNLGFRVATSMPSGV